MTRLGIERLRAALREGFDALPVAPDAFAAPEVQRLLTALPATPEGYTEIALDSLDPTRRPV